MIWKWYEVEVYHSFLKPIWWAKPSVYDWGYALYIYIELGKEMEQNEQTKLEDTTLYQSQSYIYI